MSEIPPEHRIALFQQREIRRVIHNNEWWFVIEDVVLSLIDSRDPKQYIQRMKQRDPELAKGWVQIVHTLPVLTDGGSQSMLCANAEGLFRVIQTIPSLKAEPFKRWLAKVGYERIQEIENPELATKRTRALYKAKGYSDDWIEKRMRSIAVRDELTDEWKKRGVKEQREYSILTAEISKATFGLNPSEYVEFKKLKRENLRDHMTDLELIFSMLGEAATTEITRNRDAKGFVPRTHLINRQSDRDRIFGPGAALLVSPLRGCSFLAPCPRAKSSPRSSQPIYEMGSNKKAALEGGTVAGNARRELEKQSGRKVCTSENYLALTQSAKKQLRKSQ